MSRRFLDTNVVVYAFDGDEPTKREQALAILGGDDEVVLSTQVLLETWRVLTGRLGVDQNRAADVIDQLAVLPVVQADAALVVAAVACARRYGLSIWDAMIVEAARASGCRVLLTEDLQHGQDFDGVLVSNPFQP